MVRLLQEWVQVPSEPPRQDVAQRLGEWLSAFDSVKLNGALQAIASYGASQASKPSRQSSTAQRGPMVDVPALEALCRRVKAELTALITTRVTPAIRSPSSRAHDTLSDIAPHADYGKHHQRYAELQKQMETRVAACRAHLRQALSKGSPRLRQLAALDGVMAEMLGEREQKLLAAVPVYLEQRFSHWRQVHQHKRVAAGIAHDDEEDDPQLWPQAGGWLHGFQQDMRQMLLAELQVRLQPILGLLEAAQDENT